jgi:asparagine synthase (glutamine-hydrolysing)
MTIVVGAISRDGRPLPAALRSALLANLSREATDVPDVFAGDTWLLAQVDVGAFRCKGSFNADGAAQVMAGEPLLVGPGYGGLRDRQAEAAVLCADLVAGRGAVLPAATGAFCGACYVPGEQRLTLFADKLGVRPLYYLVTPAFAAFTSALRVFEAAGLTAGPIDVRGTYDTCAFGFPLGNRTCYEGIRTIGPAELVHVTPRAEQHERYFRWDAPGPDPGGAPRSETELVPQLAHLFEDGIRRRLRGDRVTLSFLSGGLDSRAIVATLRRNDVDVLTVNFAPPETKDRHFARLAADALGVSYHQLEVPLSAAGDVYRLTQLREWVASLPPGAPRPERPGCVWSGDGGSVGMGHVYLDDATVALFERGDLEAGIRSFLLYNRLPCASNSAMTPSLRARSRTWHIEGVREEIAALQRKHDGRALFLFLMLNDQRRHLAKHFENIDRNRIEFHLPFFDSDFLEAIVRAPIQPFLRHVLYHQWLVALSPAAATVPWQTYPNHEPCPVPSDDQLRYQWGDYFGKAEDRRLARKQGREALRRLLAGPFPSAHIRRTSYASAIALGLLGSNTRGHVVRVGDTFVRYWQQCQGAPPSAADESGK